MIEIKNLTKVYRSKSKSSCKALDDVSFNLDNTGMVFICGKSGSGKSTLLNLIAGLDEVTSGEIIVDGNNFNDFTVSKFTDYRNSYIGFIFQDFCLLEDLTVEQNIEMVLQLQNKQNKGVFR